MTQLMKEQAKENRIARHLLAWYKVSQRDLPWRKTKDPYAILVSEMMLQQTQVGTVIEYYHRFLARFPSFETLAAADEQDVLAVWQGLGYYSRARNLHRLAKHVAQEYGGKLPDDTARLRALPGVGDYICGAVMSIALGKPVPAVDGNVLRVATRVLDMHADITQNKTKQTISRQVADWMPESEAGDFTQALMELGALICKPKNAECGVCPLKTECAALKNGTVDALPMKPARRKPETVSYYVWLVSDGERILMQKRESGGLLGGMWGLPMTAISEVTDIADFVRRWLSVPEAECTVLGETTHIFTHRRWHMTVVDCRLMERPADAAGQWLTRDEIAGLPVPSAFKKILDDPSIQKQP